MTSTWKNSKLDKILTFVKIRAPLTEAREKARLPEPLVGIPD